MERRLLLLPVLAWIVRGSKDVGCDHILGSNGQSYRWALQNPQLVAPVLLDYDVLEYKSPLMATLTENALIVSAAADMTANFNLTSTASSSSSPPQKYILQTIQFRKPPLVAEGTKQALNHELEAVLVHREVTGSGFFATVIVPIEVSAEPSLDFLAPLLDSAELPQEVGEVQPLLVSSLPVKLAHIFANVSFQHFWGEVTTSCNAATAGARVLMRNVTMATSKSRLQRVLDLLKYVPDKPPTQPPVQTWLVQPCPRGSTCPVPAAADLSPQLAEAQAALANSTNKLQEAKQAMDVSLTALTGNGTQISNEVYTTAVRNRDALRNAQAAVEGASRTVQTLQTQISSAASAVWDSDAPQQASAGTTSGNAAASAATTTNPASSSGTSAASTSSKATSASSAKPAFLAANSEVHGCNADLATPLEVDLSKSEHVDATLGQVGANGATEALLFWRLAATPGLRPAEAAAAENAALVPKLRLENLGDRLRVRSVDKPLMVLLADGLELPISFADISVPGQHTLAGKRAAGEIQLVHMPNDPSKAVAVSLQMDVGDTENAWFQHLGEALPRAGDATEVQGADPMGLHPAFSRGVAGHFFRYNGRLLEDSHCARVRWHVLEERGHISKSQLAALQQILRAPGSGFQTEPSALSPMLLHPRKVSLASVRSYTETVSSPVGTNDAISDRSSPSLKSLLLSLPRRSSKGQALSP